MHLSEQLWCGDRTRAQFARGAQTPIIATTQILTRGMPRLGVIKWKIILVNESVWNINKPKPPTKRNPDFCLFVHFCYSSRKPHSHANALRLSPPRSRENLHVWKWNAAQDECFPFIIFINWKRSFCCFIYLFGCSSAGREFSYGDSACLRLMCLVNWKQH